MCIPFFQVAAVNGLGSGPQSQSSAGLTPWIFPPGQPVSGRGHAGNKRVWLRWDAPRTDGGRRIDEFDLWISNASGLARVPPVWWRLPLVPKGNVTTGMAPPLGHYPITEALRRRRAPMLNGRAAGGSGGIEERGKEDSPGDAWRGGGGGNGDRRDGDAYTQFVALRQTSGGGSRSTERSQKRSPEVNRQRNTEDVGGISACRLDCDRDPRSLAFLVSGDADLRPLREFMYSFRVRSQNSYDVSRWSHYVCKQALACCRAGCAIIRAG